MAKEYRDIINPKIVLLRKISKPKGSKYPCRDCYYDNLHLACFRRSPKRKDGTAICSSNVLDYIFILKPKSNGKKNKRVVVKTNK